MAQSEALKLAKLQARENDRQRLAALLTSPPVLSMGVLFAGMYAANRIRWDQDDTRNTDVRAVVMGGVAMGALASLGVKDKWILAGAGAAAGIAGLDPVKIPSQLLKETIDVGSGALIGAEIGTAIFPVVGTVIGAGIGAGAGYGAYRATGGK